MNGTTSCFSATGAAVCTTRAETARQAAAEAGFRIWTTDVNDLGNRDDVTVVDCCVPNHLHRPVVLAALPTILVYILLGPFFVRGLMAGSLKD